MAGDRVVVHIGEYAASAKEETLVIYGLGSCVALAVFDPPSGIGGLAHVLLPGPRPPHDERADLPAKYGTEALAGLVDSVAALGADPSALRSVLVGGARLFKAAREVDRGVGPRNVERMKAALEERGLPLVAEETGGEVGRTVYFNLPACLLEVKTLGGGRRRVPLLEITSP